ncbi:hypothetical protein WJX73_001387 [Symbiochloris irregularis]|uniref:Protein kinase domain-containing protein n=1 Tax=Symbiochloris irregularis TaxID=706552 RepID=A0AAW1P9U0_9CHLO
MHSRQEGAVVATYSSDLLRNLSKDRSFLSAAMSCAELCTNDVLALDLGSVQLQGTLQSSWGTDLAAFNVVINFGYCGLEGTLPDLAQSAMPNLQVLDVRHGVTYSTTGLSGTLPASWGATRSNLQQLWLRGHRLTGTIPVEWGESGAMPQLQYLDVSYNNLTGQMPPWGAAGGAPDLTQLWVGRNNFSTTLPAAFVNLSSLQALGGSSSGFVGPLPATYGRLQNLIDLFLDGNRLTGTIPAAWGESGSFRSLTWLQVQNNSLTGTIPAWGANRSMIALDSLALYNNKELHGTVPDWGPNGSGLRSLTHLWLDPAGGLCGPLPSGVTLGDSSSDGVLNVNSLPPCPGSAPAPAPGSASSDVPAAGSPVGPAQQQTTAVQPQSSGLGSGGIAGIAVGVVAAVAVSALLAFFLWRRRKGKHDDPEQKGAPQVESSLLSRSDRMRSGALSGPLEIFLSHSTGPSDSSVSHSQLSEHSSPRTAPSAPQSSDPLRSSGTMGSPVGPLLSCAGMATLQLDWKVEPHRIKISQHPNGGYCLLGSGGFGMVYKGVMDGVNDVAIKLMKHDMVNSSSNIAKFLAEIDVLRACRDQHIVAFNGAWANEDIMYYVCEFCHNGDLYTALGDDRVCDSLLWYRRGKSIALQVAKGLFYLHSNGIMHLDIKSPNILLTKQWQAKVADVGLARILLSKTHLSKTAPGGTYHWQAPETILGYNSSFSADIFSYGVVLLEIITGLRPLRGQYKNPRVPEQCPEAIREMVVQCMQPEPDKRPTAKEIISTIQELHPDA